MLIPRQNEINDSPQVKAKYRKKKDVKCLRVKKHDARVYRYFYGYE